MASDYLLEIEGIKGESTSEGHKGSIELESFSWGLSNASSAAFGGGTGVGKVSFQDFHFVKQHDSASPTLMLSCASGKHIKKAVLTVRKAGGTQQDYYKVTLEDLLVTSFEQKADDSDSENTAPTDQFSLNFAKIDFLQRHQNPDGSFGPWEGVTWNLKTNQGGEAGGA